MKPEERIEALKQELKQAELEMAELESQALRRFNRVGDIYEARLNVAVRIQLEPMCLGTIWYCRFYSGDQIVEDIKDFRTPGAAAYAAVTFARDTLTKTTVFLVPLKLRAECPAA